MTSSDNTPPNTATPAVIDNDKLYEYSVARMERELDTSRARLTRMLLVNGLLFSAIALAAEFERSDPLVLVILTACPIAGFVVSTASLIALRASQKQRNAIKRFWEETGLMSQYPPFYAVDGHSRSARLAATSLPATLLVLWVLVFVVSVTTFEPVRTRDETGPTLSPAAEVEAPSPVSD